MKNVKLSYTALLVALAALWAAGEAGHWAGQGFFAIRDSLINYTGIVALGAMSVGVMLALRHPRAEPVLGGMDKAYRLHKWLGITALVFSLLHWLLIKAPKWMVGWGWLERPPRHPPEPLASPVLAFFRSQRHFAEEVGEWAFYAVIALVVLALLKRFPYRYFAKTHRLLAIAYLVLVFHGVVLMKFSYWAGLTAPLMSVLMAVGTVAAALALFRKVGSKRQVKGAIEELVRHPEKHVLKVAVQLRKPWPGHRAGQFAFVTFDPREGAHPFTISSAWHGDGRMFFLIKELGDYTRQLPYRLRVGDPVTVEGPYGRFDFSGDKERQIWVAGGIGITPFIARMQALASEAGGKRVDLFYSTAAADESFIGKVRQRAEAAGVRLHLWITARDGRLTADRIRAEVPDWRTADFWFCGPALFGKTLRKDFGEHGLADDDFHQELFEMR